MNDDLPRTPFAITNGVDVPSEKLFDASCGSVGMLPHVSIGVSIGSYCTFLVVHGDSGTRYIALLPDQTAVLGHALTRAVAP